MNAPKLVLLAALSLAFASSCTKVPIVNLPFPNPVLHSLEQDPFQHYLDSVFGLGNGVILTITAVQLNDPLSKSNSSDNGQAVVAYPFRSSVAGAVTSLGIFVPTTGTRHTVTLWDSASGQVLAQAEVPSLESGRWTYISLLETNQEVILQPDHGYIVGFNTLAIGDVINTPNPNNGIYILDGIYLNGGEGKAPIVPFTSGPITFEAYYIDFYDNPFAPPPFPGTSFTNTIGAFDVPGVCDIGFIPAPQ
jgi:Domain of unknown function (DUF4082)